MSQLLGCGYIGCDRFRGALLGLALVPAASGATGRLPADLARWPCADERRLNTAIAFSLDCVRAFVTSPSSFQILRFAQNGWSQDPSFPASDRSPESSSQSSLLSEQQCDLDALLLAAVPALLRYHDSWRRRQAWLAGQFAMRSPLSAAASSEILLLGDCLEIALSASALPGGGRTALREGLGQLAAAPRQYGPALGRRHYEALLSALVAGAAPQDLTGDMACHRSFVGALSGVMHCPESYDLAVCLAVRQERSAASLPVAGPVAGLLAGASGGRQALPVAWQQGCHPKSDLPSIARTVALADALFAQWAGIARPLCNIDSAG